MKDVAEIAIRSSINFLNIALGSACETEYLLILSNDLGYINDKLFFENIIKNTNEIKSKIYNLKKALIKP